MKQYVMVYFLMSHLLLAISLPTVASGASLTDDVHQKPNHLLNAFSPYLRQHAYNPIEWYSWGPEAIEKAREENKPILISVGYSTCYWCHVLERETFTQVDVAALMNQHFINIKIDREVRPDLDKVYMTATQYMTEGAGWPNNVVLTPDLKPFYSMTYLPKKRWMDVTHAIAEAWTQQRDQIDARAEDVAAIIERELASKRGINASLPMKGLLDKVYRARESFYDKRYGGFGSGTKFPQEIGLLYLLDYAKTHPNSQALSMVKNTMDHMLAGGIHDHIGGGFHRYSTEAQWRLPHFEKMLYNQALIATVLSELYAVTLLPRYQHALERLLTYVDREMTDEGGAFYSAQDAETNAVEGAFYVWNRSQLSRALAPSDIDYLNRFYQDSELPYFAGHQHPDGQVLHRKDAEPVTPAEQQKLDAIFDTLFVVRAKRQATRRDDKIVTAWNGMMIYALSRAAQQVERPEYIERAQAAADFILDHLQQADGRLKRIYFGGKSYQHAFLEDYAWLSRGLMALYQVTGEARYKDSVLSFIAILDRDFFDPDNNGYYMTDGSDGLFVRIKMGDDAGVLPAGNAVIAHVFADLYASAMPQVGAPSRKDLRQREQWKERIRLMSSAFSQGITHQAHQFSHLLLALKRIKAVALLGQPLPSEDGVPQQDNGSDTLLVVESKDKVDVSAELIDSRSTATQKTIAIRITIDPGWHINANPASLEFLVPTVADVQTIVSSNVTIDYPDGDVALTPLGDIHVYKDHVDLMATVTATQAIDVGKIRALVQLQACHGQTCYSPSHIAVGL